MSTNSDDILKDVLAHFAAIIEDEMSDIDIYEIIWETPSKEFFSNNQEVFGNIMVKYHLIYEEEMDYIPGTEFDIFPTLQHAYSYMAAKVLTKNGFDPDNV